MTRRLLRCTPVALKVLGMKVRGRAGSNGSLALYDCVVYGTFLRKLRKTSDKNNLNRTERQK